MIYVIGSGPAGVSSAMALLDKGHQVTMLDAGLELESDRQQLISSMSSLEPDQWDQSSLKKIKENMEPNASGIPLKYSYGSDFPYRETKDYIPSESKNVGLVPSLAKGGLSNVWGAAVLPYLAEDINDWPVTLEELEPHYKSIFSFMWLAAVHDDLETRFPLYSDSLTPLRMSKQIEMFLRDLSEYQDDLQTQGILFGKSRLAVSPHNQQGRSCVYCALCMYGCPYGLIYNAASTLDILKRHPNFTYTNGIVVQGFKENEDSVEIKAWNRSNDGLIVKFVGTRLYLAAGVLSSTKIFLDSIEAYDQTVTLKDSQYFLLPLLRYKATPDIFNEQLNTLSQAFIEIFDKKISDKCIHLQVYSYNELYRQAIQKTLSFSYPMFSFASDMFLKRFLLIQGYLHSDFSARINVSLKAPNNKDSISKLILEGQTNKATPLILKKLVGKLYRNRKFFKAVPLKPLMNVSQPGRGFHTGGSLPMKENPTNFETDKLGRPVGFKRVHIVDSTVFPSIAATTITLTEMANAHRIASESV